ncbi:MAG: penicillin-binding protein 2 [bacterium]
MSELFPFSKEGTPFKKAANLAYEASPLDTKGNLFLGNSLSKFRVMGAGFAAAIIIFVFGAKLVQMQIQEGGMFRTMAEGNRIKVVPLASKRGLIFDRNGTPLAINSPSFRIVVVPSELPKDKAALQNLLLDLTDATQIQPREFEEELSSAPPDSLDPIVIPREISREQAVKLLANLDVSPGIYIEVGTKRNYPESAANLSLSHILGYTGKLSPREINLTKEAGYLKNDFLGKTGLEQFYETELRGTYGWKKVEVMASGEASRVISSSPQIDGLSLKLSLDLGLQKKSEQVLNQTLNRLGLKKGVVIVMEPATGAILALVSLPGYDDNLFSSGISIDAYEKLTSNPDQPLFFRAISGEYPSGSTIKIVYAAAALATKIITPETAVLSTGGIRIGQWFFPDWKAGGHGTVNVRKAIAESVNTFFYMIGGGYESFTGMGIEGLKKAAEAMGIGQGTGIDLPNEAKGFFPSAEWKERVKNEVWYVGDTYHAAIGQGDVLVTPVEVARYLCFFANGGTLVTPRVASALVSNGDQEIPIKTPVLPPTFLDAQSVQTVRLGMRDAVTKGSARSLTDLPFATAGKTGTAEVSGNKNPHAWFVGFGPFDHPEIAVMVLVENGIEGSTNATPIAKEIFKYWWENRQTPIPTESHP